MFEAFIRLYNSEPILCIYLTVLLSLFIILPMATYNLDFDDTVGAVLAVIVWPVILFALICIALYYILASPLIFYRFLKKNRLILLNIFTNIRKI